MSRLRMLLVGSIASALAVISALSLADAPAEAAFPGLNGRIACQGLRGPILAPPVPGTSRNEIFSVNPDGSDGRGC